VPSPSNPESGALPRHGPAGVVQGHPAANDVAGSPLTVAEEIGRLLGCRWSIALLTSIRSGVDRPGALQRTHQGLTEKVMRFCLARMVENGILQRVELAGRVKGTSYQTTGYGQRIMAILDQIFDAARHVPVLGSSRDPSTDPIQDCPASG
jgi:DNA-binding HxlR family transcriptional regulator